MSRDKPVSMNPLAIWWQRQQTLGLGSRSHELLDDAFILLCTPDRFVGLFSVVSCCQLERAELRVAGSQVREEAPREGGAFVEAWRSHCVFHWKRGRGLG